MTVADYLKQVPSFQTPVFFWSPVGPLRVIGVLARPRCYPFVRCVTHRGAVIEYAVLYSTELDEDVCPDCLGSGEVPSTDVPGMMATCPCVCDEARAHVQYP